jgi:hypothetical protein
LELWQLLKRLFERLALEPHLSKDLEEVFGGEAYTAMVGHSLDVLIMLLASV